MIVCRPDVEQREALPDAKLDLIEGLVGDNWKARGSSSTADGSARPEMQINIMNSRVIALLAQEKERWQLAGDQLYIDMDLSAENLPAGTRLALGSAILRSQPGRIQDVINSPHGLGRMRPNSSTRLWEKNFSCVALMPGLFRQYNSRRRYCNEDLIQRLSVVIST